MGCPERSGNKPEMDAYFRGFKYPLCGWIKAAMAQQRALWIIRPSFGYKGKKWSCKNVSESSNL